MYGGCVLFVLKGLFKGDIVVWVGVDCEDVIGGYSYDIVGIVVVGIDSLSSVL